MHGIQHLFRQHEIKKQMSSDNKWNLSSTLTSEARCTSSVQQSEYLLSNNTANNVCRSRNDSIKSDNNISNWSQGKS